MTWTKTGTEFADQCANDDLSDAAYRTHHETISWVYKVEQTSLRVPKRLVRNITFSENYAAACRELVDVGYWKDHGTEYEIVHHADIVRGSIGAQRTQREGARIRQQRARKKKLKVTENVTRDITSDPVSQTSTSLSEAREVPARANGQRARRREADLAPARDYLGEP